MQERRNSSGLAMQLRLVLTHQNVLIATLIWRQTAMQITGIHIQLNIVSPKMESHHDANFVGTGGRHWQQGFLCHEANFVITDGYLSINLQCHKWWQSWHHDNSWFSVQRRWLSFCVWEWLNYCHSLTLSQGIWDTFHCKFIYFLDAIYWF